MLRMGRVADLGASTLFKNYSATPLLNIPDLTEVAYPDASVMQNWERIMRLVVLLRLLKAYIKNQM